MEIKLGELEASILYSVCHCGDDAYGVTIADTIRERTGDNVAMGAIYQTLDRLENKGLLRSSWSEPTKERGGRKKRVFEITGAGRAALRDYDERFLSIRAGWSPAPAGAQ
jgi:DNA-binding PadR family transcriptional regulator